jgi:hypothetical protein
MGAKAVNEAVDMTSLTLKSRIKRRRAEVDILMSNKKEVI